MNNLIKVCVYSINKSYNYVGISTKQKDGKFECVNPVSTTVPFDFNFSFYAINPMSRPIPSGTNLIRLDRSTNNSLATGVVNIMYDIYSVKNLDTTVHFISYISPKKGTKPLYVWYNNFLDSTIFTFEDKFKGDEPGWEETMISPIYVFDYDNINFTCNNFECVPYIDSEDIFMQNNKYDNYDDCVSGCALEGRLRKNTMLVIPSLKDNLVSTSVEGYKAPKYSTSCNSNVIMIISIITALIMAILIIVYLFI
jgi:hypothetical protein